MDLTNYPFHVSQWPRAIASPDDFAGGDALNLSWDLGVVEESRKKKVIKAWVGLLPTLTQLKRLKLWVQVTSPVFEAACRIAGLEVLQLKWSNLQNLDPIAALTGLEALSIGSSTRVVSIEPLTRLKSLKVLEIENFKAITDFRPLTALTSLQRLSITGSMWSRQAVGSLEPFATMTGLKSLTVDTSSVTSLRPLSALTGLTELGLGGKLPYEEYAWLAAKLPNTQCRWFSPFLDMQGSGFGRCKVCGEDSLVMLTGRGKPVVCKHCEAEKVADHVSRFDAVRERAEREA